MNRETEKRVRENLLSAPFIFARTMPENPHHYTLRKNWARDEEFVEAVLWMREYGYSEIYKGRPYTMYNLNGHKYWTMGAPIDYSSGKPCTILINRKRLDYQSDYDLIADRYDAMFADEASHNENLEVFNRLGFDGRGRVLDIGCGTGLFLDYVKTEQYVGIDPSTKMLQRSIEAHQAVPGRLERVNARLEEFHDAEGFDLIVALFGAANYVEPVAWDRVFASLKPGGRIFAMFYAERYLPVTYEKAGIALPHHNLSEYDLSRFRITPHRNTYVIAEYPK